MVKYLYSAFPNVFESLFMLDWLGGRIRVLKHPRVGELIVIPHTSERYVLNRVELPDFGVFPTRERSGEHVRLD